MNQRSKQILTIIAVIVACFLVAVTVLVLLKKVAPKDTKNTANSNSTTSETAETKLVKEGDSAAKAGEEAFNSRDTDKAIAEFAAAKALYEKAGDTARAEQMADRIAVAQHEATKSSESEPKKAPGNPAPPENTIGGKVEKATSEN